MLVISLIGQGVFLIAALVVSAKVTVRRRSVIKGGLCLYGLCVLWIVLFSILIPLCLVALGTDKHAIARAFPEATGVLPVILLSWIHSFIFAGLAHGVHLMVGKPDGKRC